MVFPPFAFTCQFILANPSQQSLERFVEGKTFGNMIGHLLWGKGGKAGRKAVLTYAPGGANL